MRFDGEWIGLVLILAFSRSVFAKPPLPEEKDADGIVPALVLLWVPIAVLGPTGKTTILGIDRSVPPPWTPILVEEVQPGFGGVNSTFRKRCFHAR